MRITCRSSSRPSRRSASSASASRRPPPARARSTGSSAGRRHRRRSAASPASVDLDLDRDLDRGSGSAATGRRRPPSAVGLELRLDGRSILAASTRPRLGDLDLDLDLGSRFSGCRLGRRRRARWAPAARRPPGWPGRSPAQRRRVGRVGGERPQQLVEHLGRRHVVGRELGAARASARPGRRGLDCRRSSPNPTRRTSLRSRNPVAAATRSRTSSMTARTSAADAALGRLDEVGVLLRHPRRADAQPRRPRPSTRLPALTSPGTGLTNTEPQFWPPGWCSRRQRTISAIVASAAARSPRATRSVRRDDDLVVAEVGAPEPQAELAAHRATARPASALVEVEHVASTRGRRRCPSRGRRRSSARRRRPCPARRPPTRAR